MRKSVRSMRHATEGDTSFSAANCRTDFYVGDEATLARMVPTVSGVRTRGLLPPLFLPVTFPVSRNCSTNVIIVFLAVASLHLSGFWTGAGLWQSNLFAETIPQFEVSALSLVTEPSWMTSQRQVLPSMEKILMYDDYGATTYIELCTFSIVCCSNRIYSNWLKRPVGTHLIFAVCMFSYKTHLYGNWFYWYRVQLINNGTCSAGSIDRN